MSVILEFKQITNKEVSTISELRSCEIYEIENIKHEKGRECYIQDTDLFEEILMNRDSWQGEVYNIPMIHNYLFFILAMDFEDNIGHRIENDEIVFLAFDPKPIQFVVSQAIIDVPKISSHFDELHAILQEAVEKDFLISVKWS